MKTRLEALIATREIIAEERNWTRGAMARDGAGNPVSVNALEACRWCLYGAYWKACGAMDPIGLGTLLELPEHSIDWNDRPERRHVQVLDRLDRAIERERAAA